MQIEFRCNSGKTDLAIKAGKERALAVKALVFHW